MINGNRDLAALTARQFARLGDGAIAYVTTVTLEDAQRLFPEATDIPRNKQLFALLAADGSPIMLADSKGAAIAKAWLDELKTVTVH
ncbi:MAG: DUF1150 domain-containing protein [Hyphomicrobiales bacterium]|nr:DUF1150 domain-containing protein [Hyphomicrobiales bacterium]MBV8663812.1 DUF1150 domain-containing protein [Hyphomicrobiales bacterium]